MIEKRLTRLETTVDDLTAGQVELRTEVSELRGEMRTGFEEVRGEILAVRVELGGRMDELGHQMRVLHEDTLANIRDLAPDFAPIRREFHAAEAELRKDINLVKAALEKRPRPKQR